MQRHANGIRRRWSWIAASLLVMHWVIWAEEGTRWMQPLLLVHVGLFLLGLPFRPNRRIGFSRGMPLILVCCLLIFLPSRWPLTLWILLLIGFSGSCITLHRRENFMLILMLAFLVADLLFGCLPRLFDVQMDANVNRFFAYAPAAAPLAMLLIATWPKASAASHAETDPLSSHEPLFDPLQGVALGLLVALLALASLLATYYTGTDYLHAALWTLLGISGGLLAIDRLFPAPLGLGGMAPGVSSLLYTVPPLEKWLTSLSRLAQASDAPEAFLDRAFERLTALPRISGVTWSSVAGRGRHGRSDRHEIRVLIGDLVVSIHTHRPLAPLPALYCRLFIELTEHFYLAKQQEQALARQTQLQAIHETGARLTHDIKNLLQSLQALLELLRTPKQEPSRAVLERHLSELIARLRLMLDKLLASPTAEPESPSLVPVMKWWDALQRRHARAGIRFRLDGDKSPEDGIPGELFDNVVDNLLENVRHKNLTEDAVRISLHVANREVVLEVCDDGAALPVELVGRILREPVPSASGLGIGLYQAARWATQAGYTLVLRSNEPGAVCFELSGPSAPLPDRLVPSN